MTGRQSRGPCVCEATRGRERANDFKEGKQRSAHRRPIIHSDPPARPKRTSDDGRHERAFTEPSLRARIGRRLGGVALAYDGPMPRLPMSSARLASCVTSWVFLAVALVGCSAADDAIDTAAAPKVTTLAGTWRTDGVAEERPAHVTVEQRGLSARLSLVLEGHPCAERSVLEAEISTEGLTTSADVAGMHFQVTGEPGLAEILGNFRALQGGPCRDQAGRFSLR